MSNLQLFGNKLMWHLEKLAEWQKGKDIYPLHIDLGPSSACNQNCRFCYVGYLGKKKPIFLGKDVFLKLMQDLGRLKIESVALCGTGEPFLNKATPEAILTAKEAGVDVAVITNGVFFSPKIAEKVLGSLTWIRFSVYGDSQKVYDWVHRGGKYDWVKVNINILKAVEIKRKNNYPTTLGAVVILLPENGHEMPSLAKKLRDYGIDYMVIKPPSQNPRNKLFIPRDLAKRFSTEIKKAEGFNSENFRVEVRWDLFEHEESFDGENSPQATKPYEKCLGLPFIACIDADGSVYACNGFWRSSEFLYGNLYQNSFEEIWKSNRRKKVMDFVKNKLDLSRCEPFCRHNSINIFLWDLVNPPRHINFP